MRALCLITARPDASTAIVRRLRRHKRAVKDVVPVTGRADICVFLQGSINEINKAVIDFKRIGEIVTTETMMEVEVNLGW